MKKIKWLLPIIGITPLITTSTAMTSCSKSEDIYEASTIQFSANKAFNLSLFDGKHWSGDGTEGKDWKLEYKKEDGSWETWTDGTAKIPSIKSGNKYILNLRGTGINTFCDSSDIQDLKATNFVFTNDEGKDFNVSCAGDIRNLLNYKDVDKATMKDYCFFALFSDCSNLTTMPDLPSEFVTACCYESMFENCTRLSIPSDYVLPATKHLENGEVKDGLALSCYQQMFSGCLNITTLPTCLLPALILADDCYEAMFQGCGNLISIPKDLLPATEMAPYCYDSMFSNTGIVIIPDRLLHADQLAEHCYDSMFSVCEGITSIPDTLFLTEKLAPSCYMNMFCGCHNLKKLQADLLPATLLYDNCYEGMFSQSGVEEIEAGLLPAGKPNAETGEPEGELAPNCYQDMFNGCTNLKTLPVGLLPATKLETSCYLSMFESCVHLTTLPEGFFPATATLAKTCFQQMFKECSALDNLPSNLLPYTELAEGCYYTMFSTCTSLTNAPALPATTLYDGVYSHMFFNCDSLMVYEDDATATEIFTCPDLGELPDPVTNMFGFGESSKTNDRFTGTPTAGHKYSWKSS